MKPKITKDETEQFMDFVLRGPYDKPQSMATKDMLWKHINNQYKECLAVRKFMLVHFAKGLIDGVPKDLDTTLLNQEMEDALRK